ncbi:restriction endonuclease subunit S [Prevotella copri]|nr:restriction endonuclease subunit S [Segatella copri]MCF2609933.1 restriction endonuclease subunit S [Segatella copri]
MPKGWVWTTLGEIGSWQSGATPSRMNKDYYGGNIPWLKTGDLNDGTITYIPEYITQRALEETSVRLNPKGSVLIAMYGATIGKIGILSFPATTNQACCACYEYSINQMFLFYFLLANRENFIAMGGGGAQPNISKEKIISTSMPLPPLKEQERIVAEIERWLSFVDIVEKEKSDLQSTICLVKSKILDLAIHGKLVPQDPNDEPASELLKRINPKAEITCDTPQYGKLPFVIPSSWEWVKLSGIAKSNIGLTYRPTDIVSTGVPVYRSNNIRNGKIDTTDLVKVSTKILEKQLLHVGDLLICARNGSRNLIGKNAIISELKEPTSFGAFMAVCRSAYNQWIRIVLNSEYFDRYLDDSNSATINQVTQKMLLALPIPLPPHQEQHRIVAKIEELFAQLDKIEASL